MLQTPPICVNTNGWSLQCVPDMCKRHWEGRRGVMELHKPSFPVPFAHRWGGMEILGMYVVDCGGAAMYKGSNILGRCDAIY